MLGDKTGIFACGGVIGGSGVLFALVLIDVVLVGVITTGKIGSEALETTIALRGGLLTGGVAAHADNKLLNNTR